jgi:TatD DNase family protein
MLVDTHCHLDAAEFDSDRDAVAHRARQAGVTTIVVPGVERANFGAVAGVCRDYAGCVPAYGIHPMYVFRARDEDLDALRTTLRESSAIAVGEIGLDFYASPRDPAADARQEHFFAEQLKIARELDLPVILHVRRAIDAVLKHLRRIPVRGGIAHAFNGSRQQAEAFFALGFKLGFGGAMTHGRARHLRELAATLPLEGIVLETDAPDIPPEWLGNRRNEPGELPRIAVTLGSLRGLGFEEVAAAAAANARAALPGLNS